MGWSTQRWRDATFTELNYAIEGYFKNWEQDFGETIRQINYCQISGNPNIKPHQKPKSPRDYMPLSIDKKKKKESKKLSQDEIDKIQQELKDGFSKQSDSKD